MVRQFLPGLELSLLDLGEGSPADIRAWDAAPIVKLTLAFMRAVVDAKVDVLEVLETFAEELTKLLQRPGGLDAFLVVVGYSIRRRTDLNVAAMAARAAALVGPEAGEAVKSTADQLIDQGIEQGELRNARRTLLRLLQVRFGPPADEVTSRVNAAPLEELTGWTERLLTAASVEDVFATG